MSTTQPPAGRAPGGGAVARPVQRHRGLALAAITTAGRDLPDKATPVPAAIAGTSPPQASQHRGQTT